MEGKRYTSVFFIFLLIIINVLAEDSSVCITKHLVPDEEINSMKKESTLNKEKFYVLIFGSKFNLI